MFVRVLLKNGTISLVPEGELDRMVRDKEVTAIRRDSRWAVIAEVPLRKQDLPFPGAGRRWSDLDQMWEAISRVGNVHRRL